MVKIIDYELRQTQEGKAFYALILQGETEIAQSENGNFYATARKCSLPSTFTEEVCSGLIGKELSGSIEKVRCEPYEYMNPRTGDITMLDYRNIYVPEDEKDSSTVFPDITKPSENGVLEHA